MITVRNVMFFALVFFCSCVENNKQKIVDFKEIVCLNKLYLSPLVDSLFTEYFKKNSKEYAYGIFIDKKSESKSDYVITIAPFAHKVNSLYESGAANYFKMNDSVFVFIYTGMEEFLISDSSKFALSQTKTREATGEFKNIDFYSKIVDFSKGISFVHFDTSTYVLNGSIFPFSSIRELPPTVFLQR